MQTTDKRPIRAKTFVYAFIIFFLDSCREVDLILLLRMFPSGHVRARTNIANPPFLGDVLNEGNLRKVEPACHLCLIQTAAPARSTPKAACPSVIPKYDDGRWLKLQPAFKGLRQMMQPLPNEETHAARFESLERAPKEKALRQPKKKSLSPKPKHHYLLCDLIRTANSNSPSRLRRGGGRLRLTGWNKRADRLVGRNNNRSASLKI